MGLVNDLVYMLQLFVGIGGGIAVSLLFVGFANRILSAYQTAVIDLPLVVRRN